MVSAIENIMSDPESARLRAESGRNWVDNGFIRDDLARRMAVFLEKVLDENRAKH